jgi:hypothetical protein
MATLLNDKPQIGILSSFGSWFLYCIKHLLTDDAILKLVAGAGIYIGVAVGILAGYLHLIQIIKERRGSKKPKS